MNSLPFVALFGIYPVTVVIALFLLERDNPGYGNDMFFGALFWPVVILIVIVMMIKEIYNRITAE